MLFTISFFPLYLQTLAVSNLQLDKSPNNSRLDARGKQSINTMTQLMQVTKTVNAPVDEVWAIISAWGSERLWFPGVAVSSVKGFGIGSVRTLTFATANMSVSERLESADPATHTLSYSILQNDDRMKNPSAQLSLEVLDDGKQTRFTWTGYSEWVDPEYRPTLTTMLEAMYNQTIDAVSKIVSK